MPQNLQRSTILNKGPSSWCTSKSFRRCMRRTSRFLRITVLQPKLHPCISILRVHRSGAINSWSYLSTFCKPIPMISTSVPNCSRQVLWCHLIRVRSKISTTWFLWSGLITCYPTHLLSLSCVTWGNLSIKNQSSMFGNRQNLSLMIGRRLWRCKVGLPSARSKCKSCCDAYCPTGSSGRARHTRLIRYRPILSSFDLIILTGTLVRRAKRAAYSRMHPSLPPKSEVEPPATISIWKTSRSKTICIRATKLSSGRAHWWPWSWVFCGKVSTRFRSLVAVYPRSKVYKTSQ